VSKSKSTQRVGDCSGRIYAYFFHAPVFSLLLTFRSWKWCYHYFLSKCQWIYNMQHSCCPLQNGWRINSFDLQQSNSSCSFSIEPMTTCLVIRVHYDLWCVMWVSPWLQSRISVSSVYFRRWGYLLLYDWQHWPVLCVALCYACRRYRFQRFWVCDLVSFCVCSCAVQSSWA
jgi:hypothetical protein